jgi:hypothetical protein
VVDNARTVPNATARHAVTCAVVNDVIFGATVVVGACCVNAAANRPATQPNALMNLAYVGALVLAGGVLSLVVALIRAARAVR